MIRTITGIITAGIILFVLYFYYEIYLINKIIMFTNIAVVVAIATSIELLSRSKVTTTRISTEDKMSVLAVIMAFTLMLSFISVTTVLAV